MTSANISAEVTNDILHGVLLFLVLKSTRCMINSKYIIISCFSFQVNMLDTS